ncbi:MAG TPA: iron-containing redox enzyme family protein [Porticoccaceae bacterium]|nr:iron-containing redox enzyme family protein [Porticoccaceae bacterium]
MNFYQRLQQDTSAERAWLLAAPILGRCLQGTVTRDEYRAFLGQAYQHVKHTVPLLMAVGSRLGDQHEWLRRAVADYIAEEYGHEAWVLTDIAAAGGDAEAVRHSRPLPATELLVAYAYDTVQRGDPIGFFGMVQVLEGTSIALATQAADALQQALDLPAAAFTYLRSHGDLDQGHVAFFASLMNRIESSREQDAICHAARMFYRLYGGMFRSLDTPDATPWN